MGDRISRVHCDLASAKYARFFTRFHVAERQDRGLASRAGHLRLRDLAHEPANEIHALVGAGGMVLDSAVVCSELCAFRAFRGAPLDLPRGSHLAELQDEISAGKTTIIVPIGGTEQNGPAMALGKHNRRVKLLGERIAVSLGNALITPVVAYVPEGNVSRPSGHMRFPGTISVPEAAFETILEYAARSFKLHGFKDVVFLEPRTVRLNRRGFRRG